MPEPNLIVAPPKAQIRTALEPAHVALNSLILLGKTEYMPGLDGWISRTLAALTPEQAHTNRLVMIGLFYALVPTRSWSSFPAYVDNMAAQEPVALRNRLLNGYTSLPCRSEEDNRYLDDPTYMLASADIFLDFLRQRFPAEIIDESLEKEAYIYLKDPLALQTLIVNHLREMWRDFLAPEWERTLPTLQACVEAFRQVDLHGLNGQEAAEKLLGQELPAWWEKFLNRGPAEKIVFVPSPHLGPYLSQFVYEDTHWILFGARQPAGTRSSSADLSRSELLVRLNALADDNRLQILQFISEWGEMCSRDIIEQVGLSQSTASRHLKQLSATGYLKERRRDGAKCYRLNIERIEDTIDALAGYLLPVN